MAGEEIGFAELLRLMARSWKWIVGLAALGGLLAAGALLLAVPVEYESSVRLLAQPQLQGVESGARPAVVYLSLLRGDAVMDKMQERLLLEGVIEEGEPLFFGDQISAAARGKDEETLVLVLTAKAAEANKAARIANIWAQVFIEESRGMLKSTATDSGRLLEEELVPTREQIAGLERRRVGVMDEFREREEKASTTWDQRISNAREKGERQLADYQSVTRRQLEEAVARNLAGGGAPGVAALRSRLMEIVSVRAELAQTPRVLTLEKAASDETLAELIAEGENAERFDHTLVSQELNPLYDQLALRALELESELKGLGGEGPPVDVAPILALLEKIQRERAAGLVSLSEAKSLEVRTLRRRRGRELEKISEERNLALQELRVRLDRLQDLETRLSARFNQSVLSDLLQKVELISMASPAVAQSYGKPRGMPLKIAAAVFLGGMLGLMIALFRTTGAEVG